MKKIFLAAIIFAAFFANAQQIPLFSQYLNNDFLLNPAVAGTKSYTPVSVSARLQWVNFNGAPSNQLGSIHSAITKNVGVGFAVTNFTAGPTRTTSAQFAYAYRFKVSEKVKLSFGLAPMLMQQYIAKDKIVLENSSDNTFNKMNGKTTIADLNAGVYAYGAKWAVGLSVPQVLENKVRLSDDLFTERLRRHYLLFGSYDFACSGKYTITPSALIKMVENGAPLQFDVNVRATYDNLFWVGLSYRGATSISFNEAAVVLVGIQKNNFIFGYSFDYGFSSIRSYSMGSHEVFLTYRIPCKDCDKPAPVAPVTNAMENQ